VLHKLNKKRGQRRQKAFELVKTTKGIVELRCFDVPKAKGRSSTVDQQLQQQQQQPTSVWQLNWTTTEALAIAPPAEASGGSRKASSRSSATRTKSWPFTVAGLLSSKQKQEKLEFEATREAEADEWVGAIGQAMQELMALALEHGHICAFKVLRIQQDSMGIVVRTCYIHYTQHSLSLPHSLYSALSLTLPHSLYSALSLSLPHSLYSALSLSLPHSLYSALSPSLPHSLYSALSLSLLHLQLRMPTVASPFLRQMRPPQQLCNLVCIFGKARQGKSTLMNVLAGQEVGCCC
jgi:hypothetical protein